MFRVLFLYTMKHLIQLYTTLKLSDERSLQIMFDTCSSLDLIDEDVAKQCNFPLKKVTNYISCGRRSTNCVKNDSNNYAFIDTPTTIARSVRTVKHRKVSDVMLEMSFLCHENATINCAEKRVVFSKQRICAM